MHKYKNFGIGSDGTADGRTARYNVYQNHLNTAHIWICKLAVASKDKARQPHPYLPRSRASTCTPVAWDQAVPCEKIGSLADQNWNLYSLVSAFNNWKRTQLAWDQAPHCGKKLARRYFSYLLFDPVFYLLPRLRSLAPGYNAIFYKLQLSGVQLYSGLKFSLLRFHFSVRFCPWILKTTISWLLQGKSCSTYFAAYYRCVCESSQKTNSHTRKTPYVTALQSHGRQRLIFVMVF